ncbi:hypothetical protein QBC35DRAFT_510632 [Podospora australis]|uniref:Uncharacterized protein n=1 Tax=Podospora australis TaxID=1536484 RepID=A0AAN6WHA4_9PEZI|nr:hypothetical protein QBC35DRAFT_510632 [Podospora australis]
MAPISQLLTQDLPTKTLQLAHHLLPRQSAPDATVTVITTGGNDSNNDDEPTDAKTLTGGAIAGIVIGSIAGLLLLIWIIRSCTNLGAPPGREADPGKPWYGGVKDEYPPRHRSPRRHSSSRHGHHHHHSRSRERRVSMGEVVGPAPPVVYASRTSRSRSPGGAYAVYGLDDVRVSRSRSRSRY